MIGHIFIHLFNLYLSLFLQILSIKMYYRPNLLKEINYYRTVLKFDGSLFIDDVKILRFQKLKNLALGSL